MLMAACLSVSLAAFFTDFSSAEVPYYGMLRGFEVGEPTAGFDIAADESGIYIAGEIFKAPGYGPMVLFLNPDHTFRCQRAIEFKVDISRGDPKQVRSAGYSVALNDNYVFVAGIYGEWPSYLHVARLFVAVFDKNTCGLLFIRELIDSTVEWTNLYPILLGAGVKILWDDDTDSLYLLLQTFSMPVFQGPFYLFQFDQSLNVLNYRKYDDSTPELLVITDMVIANNYLNLVGIDEKKGGDVVLTHILVDKTSLEIVQKWDLWVSFPGYNIASETEAFFPKVYASYSQFFNSDILYIAFTILCAGYDCSEDEGEAFRPAILWMIPPSDFRITPWTEVQLYRWNTTHWNYRSPFTHSNNTWVTDIVKADSMLYVVGFIGANLDSTDDGFVLAVNVEEPEDYFSPQRLEIQYFLRLASLEGEADTGGQRGSSVILGTGEYNGYAYLTGTASNYYLEYDPFNPLSITGETLPEQDFDLPRSQIMELKEIKNFAMIYDNTPEFDRDVSTDPAGFYGVLRLRPSTMTTITSTETATITETSTFTTTETLVSSMTFTITDTVTTTSTFTTTARTTTTVVSTPTTTVTRLTTSTQTVLSTRFETAYVSSTVYTTRVVEGTSIRYETVTYATTLTDRTTVSRIVTATTTPIVYATVRETVNFNRTVLLTRTIVIQPEGQPPWGFLLFPFIPLLLVPPLLMTVRRRLTIAILGGASEKLLQTQQTGLLNEYFKPSVGKLRKGGKVIFVNRDRTAHEIELYRDDLLGKEVRVRLEPGQKVSIKMREPGRYLFRLASSPDKIGVLEVE